MCANDVCAYAHVHVVLVPYRCSALRNREYGNVRCTSAQQAMDIFTTCAPLPALSAHTQSQLSVAPQCPETRHSEVCRVSRDESVTSSSFLCRQCACVPYETPTHSSAHSQQCRETTERRARHSCDNARAYETPTHSNSNQCNLAASRVSTTSRCAASWHPLGVQGFVDLRSPLVWSAFHS